MIARYLAVRYPAAGRPLSLADLAWLTRNRKQSRYLRALHDNTSRKGIS